MISIDLGNIWEMLTALGTIGAVIVSLTLARKEGEKKIRLTGSFDVTFHRWPALIISKSRFDQFIIEDIGYVRFGSHSLKESHFYITGKDGEHQIHDSLPYSFSKEDIIHIVFYKNFSLPKGKKIKYYIRDLEGRTYKSRAFTIPNES